MDVRAYLRATLNRAKMAEDVQKVKMVEERRRRLLAPPAPPSCPPEWSVGPPRYVGVGVQKAGTTWWHSAIVAHPEIQRTVRKEIRYFQFSWNDEFTDANIAEYHRYFPRPEHKVAGEWTPRYLLDTWTPPRLYRAAPAARIIVLLRDPMARLRSGLRHMAHHYGVVHPGFLCEAVEFGRYGAQLQWLTQWYPTDQVLVLQFERCTADPEGELRRTFEFIGVDPSFVPPDLHRSVNSSEGRALVPLPTDFVEAARSVYQADLQHVRSDWPDIDLDLWPSVAGV
jgi:hypothetical protein